MTIITTSNLTPISATQRCGDHGHTLSFYLFIFMQTVASRGYSVAVLRLLIVVTSLVAENRL